MAGPLVSVVTPTWRRHGPLLGRCIPSAAAQDYPAVEHVIVSDGLDPDLRGKLAGLDVRFTELPEHDTGARWGHWARLLGTALAAGEYIAYLDDDDAWRPDHVAVLAAALDARPAAGFAYGRTVVHAPDVTYRIGTDPPAYGQLTTSAIMHRRGLLDTATWEQSEPTIDWDLVSRWMAAGARWAYCDADTTDIWPSCYGPAP